MANICIKLIVLITIMASLYCVDSSLRDKSFRFFSGGAFRYPAVPPINSQHLKLADNSENVRFRREVEPEPFQNVNYATDIISKEELVRLTKELRETYAKFGNYRCNYRCNYQCI
uniref:Uncharacterized protein n=2 Tax=Rhodnius TaxID=13248 RepID=T1HRS4_RHOPR